MLNLTLFLWLLPLVTLAYEEPKMQVFTLQNRDAASLVNVAEQMVYPNGRVSVDPQSNALIVLARPDQLQQLQGLLAELDGVSSQVQVTVYVTEVSSKLEQRFGLDTVDSVDLSAPEFDTVLHLLDQREGGSIQNMMTATTMSNQSAYLQVTQDVLIPLEQYTRKHGTVTTYDRVPVGNQLEILPRVNGDGTIEVSLTPIVSRNPQGTEIVQRSATTRVKVPDGGTVTLGGSSTVETKADDKALPSTVSGDTENSLRVMLFVTATTQVGGSILSPDDPWGGSELSPSQVIPKRQPRVTQGKRTDNPRLNR
ncbi:MAG: secretin N-terminal domain-containing protein [Verrucomicrobiota bacterium]